MKTVIVHTDEATFKSTNVEVDKEMVDTAEQLRTGIERITNRQTTPLFVRDLEGKQISFTVDKGKNRLERETGKRLYRVIIEKIEMSKEKSGIL